MAEKLSEEQIEEFKEQFALFDTEGKGNITAENLGKVLRSLGQNPTDTELQDQIREGDANGDGVIDFSEFLSMIVERMSKEDEEDEEKEREAFRIFDIDGNGVIDFEDLKQAMKNVGEDLTDEEVKKTMRDGGSTTLYTADTVYAVYAVFTIQTCFTLLKQWHVCIYTYIVREAWNWNAIGVADA